MKMTIALAGNPNSGKTTLFNALTGANQFVGNWPGVTVEKKEGKLKKHGDVTITDLPGIYSLSPYTMEEVVARNYLIDERPDAILNIVDGTNLERNLYLTTQLCELGIPVVIAINMMDVVEKTGVKINTAELSRALCCKVVEISALKNKGIEQAAEAAMKAAENKKPVPKHPFEGSVEHAIAHIEEACVHELPEEQQRWYAVKVFERDEKVIDKLGLDEATRSHVENDIQRVEKEYDDDAESIITNERYVWIGKIISGVYKNKQKGKLSTSDKIDKVVTNRWLGLPIFIVVMFLVYYIAMVGVGKGATDWANDGLFGDGYHLVGIGDAEYDEHSEAVGVLTGVAGVAGNEALSDALDFESEDYDADAAVSAVNTFAKSIKDSDEFTYESEDEDTLEVSEETVTGEDVKSAAEIFEKNSGKPNDPAEFGVWVPGIPKIVEGWLEAANAPEWLSGLILDGIIGGVGSVLGFVPQMLVLFLLLAILEACGYMARIAFVLDRIFRRFGLSGKSFIPILIGTGCGIPGIMASRTIENERDRRMTIMTTTFIPCGAKIPFISMIAGAIFGGSPWVSTGAYFIGMAAIIVSGIMLKKTKPFAGEPAPFVMELPAYHLPTIGNVLRSTWERGWSFIKKAGTIILLSTIVLWFLSRFGWVDGNFQMLASDEIGSSMLAAVGNAISWIFSPLGWGNWQAAVASITGLIAKENIVGTMGVLYGGGELSVWQTLASVFTGVTGFSFLVFNLLCAPCFAAMGAIKREMNSAKWTAFAIAYQCAFAYAVALCINQIGGAFTGNLNIIGLIVSIFLIAGMLFMLFKPYKEADKLTKKVKVK
ncbi:ferrous iron transporter B [Lachnoclostridium sp. MSJ-17]|uniref:ferrous iron transporter B n=1 Tax=Lachnoclostridium sp. MSJ-17 TaxID=2841516 RepID=UPI001C125B21|nr:ferrous iron transporter B [Lachnoclostridium sp. MSJ-17]MBU5461978.1 ferrous iron transporter B [Lachnoclostridium sp. MSJ-17]